MGRTTILTAVRLASRRRGVTAPELAEVTGHTESASRRTLAVLADDGVLAVDDPSPARAGKARGDWRKVYRLVKVR